jgi:hypothetical protein
MNFAEYLQKNGKGKDWNKTILGVLLTILTGIICYDLDKGFARDLILTANLLIGFITLTSICLIIWPYYTRPPD